MTVANANGCYARWRNVFIYRPARRFIQVHVPRPRYRSDSGVTGRNSAAWKMNTAAGHWRLPRKQLLEKGRDVQKSLARTRLAAAKTKSIAVPAFAARETDKTAQIDGIFRCCIDAFAFRFKRVIFLRYSEIRNSDRIKSLSGNNRFVEERVIIRNVKRKRAYLNLF